MHRLTPREARGLAKSLDYDLGVVSQLYLMAIAEGEETGAKEMLTEMRDLCRARLLAWHATEFEHHTVCLYNGFYHCIDSEEQRKGLQ